MTKEQDLAKLENIVENLLLKFNGLKQEKNELVAQIQAKEEKIIELQTQIESLSENRSEVHGRVSNLINSIEDWEKSFFAEDDDGTVINQSAGKKKSGAEERGEAHLFSIGE